MAHFHNPCLAGAGGQGGYEIDQSLRFNSADSYTFRRTPSSNSTSQKKFTVSAWVKRGVIASGGTNNVGRQLIFYTGLSNGAGNLFDLEWNDDKILVYFNGAGSINPQTVAKFRDPSAWYHIVVAVDTAQATAADRFKIYVNGTEQALTGTLPTLDLAVTNGTTSIHAVADIGTLRSNQYIAELYYINDQQLTPGDFGELNTDGAWIPKKYAGTFAGTNSCYLKFDPSATNGIGHDHSGNGNNWTATGFTTSGTGTDVMSDTPTTNWCTWNPLKRGTNLTPSDGNLFAQMQSNASGINQSATATLYITSGKWYWEGTSFNTVSGYGQQFGIASDAFNALNSFSGTTGQTYGYSYDGSKYNGSTFSSYGSSYTSGDVVGVALDLDAGTLAFYKNGVSQGTAFTGISGTFTPYCGLTYSGGGPGFTANFGQRAFAYTPPTGYKALNTANLPEPTIKDGSEYFNTVLYTGNDGTQSVPGVGFQPDLVWIKNRGVSASHWLNDAVRGAGLSLASNTPEEEKSYSAYFTAFGSDGFSLAGGTPGFNDLNNTYVSWNWKAGGTGSSIAAGSIDGTNPTIASTVSANASAGFSIVTYTGNSTAGATIGHGLGVAPSMVIVKSRTYLSTSWCVSHSGYPTTQTLYLDSTTGVLTRDRITARSATTFTVGSHFEVNDTGDTYVAYCFSEVAGYSKFGSYTGNGLADGPFVFLGFRPAFIMFKRTDTTDNWRMYDSTRNTYNAGSYVLYPNLSNAEDASTDHLDWLSNGFKLRSTNNNASSGTYVFAAFAKIPYKFSLAV